MASRTVEPRDLWRIWKTIFPEESFPISSWTAPGLAYQPPQNRAAPLGSQAWTTWPSIVRSAFPAGGLPAELRLLDPLVGVLLAVFGGPPGLLVLVVEGEVLHGHRLVAAGGVAIEEDPVGLLPLDELVVVLQPGRRLVLLLRGVVVHELLVGREGGQGDERGEENESGNA